MKTAIIVLSIIAVVFGACGPEPDQIVCSSGSDGVEICREMICYKVDNTTTCYDVCTHKVNDATGWMWVECPN